LGDYGAGKTTFCRHFFINQAKAFLKNPGKERMPIYVNLRSYPEHLNLPSVLTDLLVNKYGARCRGFATVEKLLRDGKIVIVFDAFDEMASRTDYSTTLNNFHALEKMLKDKAKALLTCRTHYFKDQEELHTVHRGTQLYQRAEERHYEIIHLQPLALDEIKTYVRSVCGTSWESYYQQMEETYNLMALAKRPILLDMITQVLPDLVQKNREVTSANLYRQYTRLWLERDDWRTRLSHEDRYGFTVAFAYAMYQENATTFQWINISKAIKSRYGKTANVEGYEYDIRTCTFIHRDPTTNLYSFVHESFAEYFVASHLYGLIVQEDIHCLMERVHKYEVLVFLSEHQVTSELLRIITNALKSSDSHALIANCLVLLSGWARTVKGLVISEILLDEYRVSKLKLDSARIEDSRMNSTRITEGYWVKCDTNNCYFDHCEFDRCDFLNTTFEETKFMDVKYVNCSFDGVRWKKGIITGSISGCRFKDCQFDAVSIASCRIESCSFEEVSFENASVEDVVILNSSPLGIVRWPSRPKGMLTLMNVTFQDSGRSLLKALQRVVIDLKKPIRIQQSSGLDAYTKRKLKAKGVEVID
jgi:hypothetical protein